MTGLSFGKITRVGEVTLDRFGPVSSILVSPTGKDMILACPSGVIGKANLLYNSDTYLSSVSYGQNRTISDGSGGVVVSFSPNGIDFFGAFSTGIVRSIPFDDPYSRFPDFEDPLSFCDSSIQTEISTCVSSNRNFLVATLPPELDTDGPLLLVCGSNGWICDQSVGESSRFLLPFEPVALTVCQSQLFLISKEATLYSVLVSHLPQQDIDTVKLFDIPNMFNISSMSMVSTNDTQLSLFVSNQSMLVQYTVELPTVDDSEDIGSVVFSVIVLLGLFAGAIVVPLYMHFRRKAREYHELDEEEVVIVIPRKIGRRPGATILEE